MHGHVLCPLVLPLITAFQWTWENPSSLLHCPSWPNWCWMWRLVWETSNTCAPRPRSKRQKNSNAIAIKLHSKFKRGGRGGGSGKEFRVRASTLPWAVQCTHWMFKLLPHATFSLHLCRLWVWTSNNNTLGWFFEAWGWWLTIAQLWWKHYSKSETHVFCDLQMLIHHSKMLWINN